MWARYTVIWVSLKNPQKLIDCLAKVKILTQISSTGPHVWFGARWGWLPLIGRDTKTKFSNIPNYRVWSKLSAHVLIAGLVREDSSIHVSTRVFCSGPNGLVLATRHMDLRCLAWGKVFTCIRSFSAHLGSNVRNEMHWYFYCAIGIDHMRIMVLTK